jgi:hypothetical protein
MLVESLLTINHLRLLAASLFAIVIFVQIGPNDRPAQAQEIGAGWSLPVDLAIDREGRSLYPTMKADSAGGLHIFWDEVIESNGGNQVIVDYAYWDGNRWEGPIDVFVGRRGQLALGADFVIDEAGYLHTIWIDELGINYARRHISSPVAASSWSNRQRILAEPGGNVQMPRIAIDENGILHIAVMLTAEQPGVYYIRSFDRGETWELPRPISDLSVTDWRQGRLRYQIDMLSINETIHVVWQQIASDGPSKMAYVRGYESGNEWSIPEYMQEGGSWPKLTLLSDETLLLASVGESAAGKICMKRQSISTDQGESWSPMEIVFAPVKGCLGSAPIATDGDGTAHLVMSAYNSTLVVERIWYTVRGSEGWRDPEELLWPGISYENRDLGTQPDFPSSAITGGNLLHAVFMTDEGNIWYSTLKLEASEIQPIVYPLPEEITTESSTTNDSSTILEIQPHEDGSSEITDPVPSQNLGSDSPENTYPGNPFMLGVIASAALIVIVVLISLRRRRYQR